jgi:hypothetical protein
MSSTYDAWLDQQVTAADEYDAYWERFFEQAEEDFQAGRYDDEYDTFLEDRKNKRAVPHIFLYEDFIEKKARELEAAFSKQEADIRTEMAVIRNQRGDGYCDY